MKADEGELSACAFSSVFWVRVVSRGSLMRGLRLVAGKTSSSFFDLVYSQQEILPILIILLYTFGPGTALKVLTCKKCLFKGRVITDWTAVLLSMFGIVIYRVLH